MVTMIQLHFGWMEGYWKTLGLEEEGANEFKICKTIGLLHEKVGFQHIHAL